MRAAAPEALASIVVLVFFSALEPLLATRLALPAQAAYAVVGLAAGLVEALFLDTVLNLLARGFSRIGRVPRPA